MKKDLSTPIWCVPWSCCRSCCPRLPAQYSSFKFPLRWWPLSHLFLTLGTWCQVAPRQQVATRPQDIGKIPGCQAPGIFPISCCQVATNCRGATCCRIAILIVVGTLQWLREDVKLRILFRHYRDSRNKSLRPAQSCAFDAIKRIRFYAGDRWRMGTT